MDERFLVHNSHLEGITRFSDRDPQLRRLKSQKYTCRPLLLSELPVNIPGVFTLTGGRQVGKTTLLKQWMRQLLNQNIKPQDIFFVSGELIDNHHMLLKIIQQQLGSMSKDKCKYLLVDEVTYIKDWDKAVKYAADAGWLDSTELVVTGSDSVLIKQARMRFPGRRGRAKTTDFHLYPLSFKEVLNLKQVLESVLTNMELLYSEFNNYLQHGGFLTAINDLAMNNTISAATLDIYADWVRGDMLNHGKQESYLQEIIGAIIKRYGSQVSWHAIAKDLSIDHHKTVADYVDILASMDVVFVQSALLEDKLTAAPKKAKKIIFSDPFIFHAMNFWLNHSSDPYQNLILTTVNSETWSAKLVEACAISLYKRHYPTYYIKAGGEVDIAYVDNNKFWPVEIKWTTQLRPQDLKQVFKYEHSLILAKQRVPGMIHNIPIKPLPLSLIDL